jgi:hypothetical protein
MQDGFNTASLSLYASLGFDVKHAVALMQAAPGAQPQLGTQPEPSVRPMVASDLSAVEQLSSRIYGATRRNEVAAAIRFEFSPLVRERGGRVAGYLIPGMFGHGVAETNDDAMALIGETARRLAPEFARFFCPLDEAELFRAALVSGCRTIKVMNLMTMGPYEPPRGVWLPSVLY